MLESGAAIGLGAGVRPDADGAPWALARALQPLVAAKTARMARSRARSSLLTAAGS
jgi:hypothetical protein